MRLKPLYDLPRHDWVLIKKRPQPHALPQEQVRQWILAELLRTYHYPAAWIASRIVRVDEADERWPIPKGFAGMALLTSRGDPFLWISIEKPGRGGQAEDRLRTVLDASATAGVGLSTDGSREGTRVLRRRFDRAGCHYVADLEPYVLPPGMRSNLHFAAPGSRGKARGRRLQIISSNAEDIFFEAHSHIRDIDGLHADDSLDELCKILHAKLYDEQTTPAGRPYALQPGECGTTEEFAAIIRRVYADANGRESSSFNSPIRLSSPALAKVAESLQQYSLSESSIDVKGRAFQRVLVPALRAGMGQYFTPHEVIRFMVDVACPSTEESVLDPFAGSGHFLTQCAEAARGKTKKRARRNVSDFASHRLHGIEKSDRMVRVATTDMRLHGSGQANIKCADALLEFNNYSEFRPESFDLILTNPPFGSLLGADAIRQLGHFELAAGRKTVALEVLGLERCAQFLRPGGRLGIVLPDGILGNRGTAYVRDWLGGQFKLRAIVSLPVETFSPFGANIKTSILFARKWRKNEKRTQDYHVHLSRIDNVGYDATGRPQPGSELDPAASTIRKFLSVEGW